jgi:hypothetical protein
LSKEKLQELNSSTYNDDDDDDDEEEGDENESEDESENGVDKSYENHSMASHSQTSSFSEHSKEMTILEDRTSPKSRDQSASRCESLSILDTNKEKAGKHSAFEKIIHLPFKDVLTEAELQVKIADLGNACWTVNLFDTHI